MLGQRILTAAVLLPLFLAALLLLPNLYWTLLIAALLAVAAREWARLAGFAAAGQAAYALVVLVAALEHDGGATQAFVYSAPGKLLYALCAAFWLAIVPAWLYYRWIVRSRPLLAVVGAVVLLPFWHALAWLQLMP